MLQVGAGPRFLFVVVVLLGIELAGCSGSPSTLAPASPEARKIAELFWGVLAVSAVIFLLVEGLLIYALVRFRDRQGAPMPKQVHGNLRLEIAWTAVPALVVVGIFVAMIPAMNAVTRQQPGALRVRVVGHQWWWQIEYPDLGIVTASDLHVPVGQPVEVELLSSDVVHSFWAPELFGKADVIPGHSTWTRFVAERNGVYRGECAEFCGGQHANMGFFIIAEPEEEFEEWVERLRSLRARPVGGQAAVGEQAFFAGSCPACHTIDGTRAQGKVGPDLTNFGGRRSIAAAALENTTENLASWIADPQSVKPGNKMRVTGLSGEMIRNLVAFLESLR